MCMQRNYPCLDRRDMWTGIHNFLYAFSPDCGGSGNDEDIYPGDAYVDVIGTDCYFAPNRGTQYVQGALDQVRCLFLFVSATPVK